MASYISQKMVAGDEIVRLHGLLPRDVLALVIRKGLRPWNAEGYQLFLDKPWSTESERLHAVGEQSFDPAASDKAEWLGALARQSLGWHYLVSEVDTLLELSEGTRAILRGMADGEQDVDAFSTALVGYLGPATPAEKFSNRGFGAGPVDAMPGRQTPATKPGGKKPHRLPVTQSVAASLCGVSDRQIGKWDKGVQRPDRYPGRHDLAILTAWAETYKAGKVIAKAARVANHPSTAKPWMIDTLSDDGSGDPARLLEEQEQKRNRGK